MPCTKSCESYRPVTPTPSMAPWSSHRLTMHPVPMHPVPTLHPWNKLTKKPTCPSKATHIYPFTTSGNQILNGRVQSGTREVIKVWPRFLPCFGSESLSRSRQMFDRALASLFTDRHIALLIKQCPIGTLSFAPPNDGNFRYPSPRTDTLPSKTAQHRQRT